MLYASMMKIPDKAITLFEKYKGLHQMTNVAFVPNGTQMDSLEYVHLVEKYRLFAKKSAENIIGLAETLVIAEDNLAPSNFRQFCEEVGLKQDGSTFRKLIEIGKKVSRFQPFVERMPNTWTTVYKLASLKENEFDRVTKSDLFTPFMTAVDVNLIVNGASEKKAEKHRDLVIDLSDLEQSVKIDLYCRVKALKEQYASRLQATLRKSPTTPSLTP
jgi:hypothetical protein